VTAIGCGRDHGLAVLGDGTVRSWGANAFGQLGDGTTTNRTAPVTVSGLTGCRR
jgi:alpha-tubulin suppressor-like RCC1 family protein